MPGQCLIQAREGASRRTRRGDLKRGSDFLHRFALDIAVHSDTFVQTGRELDFDSWTLRLLVRQVLRAGQEARNFGMEMTREVPVNGRTVFPRRPQASKRLAPFTKDILFVRHSSRVNEPVKAGSIMPTSL